MIDLRNVDAIAWPDRGSRGILRAVDRRFAPMFSLACVVACSSARDTSPPAPSAEVKPPVVAVSDPSTQATPPTLTVAPTTPAAPSIDPIAVGFFGAPEAESLARLRAGEIVAVKKGSGGRSLGFKLTFADGTQAYFKPEQTFSGASWYAEIAAHQVDRALGLGRVPPVVSRELGWDRLLRAAGDDPRVSEVIVRDGKVRGALVLWVEGELSPLVTPPGWENWVRVEPWNAYNATPFQRAREYYAALQHPRTMPAYETVPTPDRQDRAAELSDLLVFDFLTLNIDRWGGGNANVLTIGKGGPVVFLDNGAAFAHGPPQLRLMQDRLKPLQKFRRALIDAVRSLDVEQLAASLAADRLAPILTDTDLEGLAIRRIAVLDHVAELQAVHGDTIFPW